MGYYNQQRKVDMRKAARSTVSQHVMRKFLVLKTNAREDKKSKEKYEIMQNIKNEYLKILDEYISEPMFITANSKDIDTEIEKNYWWIGGTKEQISSLSSTEWLNYFKRLIDDRQRQLNKSNVKTDLLFYCYHDELAGQLRFNVISAAHTKLPFGCKYIEDTLENVLNSFVNAKYKGSIPLDELVPISKDEAEMLEKEKNEYILKVYIRRLDQDR